jgi:hypothetical protein
MDIANKLTVINDWSNLIYYSQKSFTEKVINSGSPHIEECIKHSKGKMCWQANVSAAVWAASSSSSPAGGNQNRSKKKLEGDPVCIRHSMSHH